MTMRTSQFVEDPQGVRKYDARLAMVIGDRAATFVQQVHYHAAWKEEQFGAREWRSSLSEWEKTFPYWSVDTIKRIIKDCREIGVLKVRKGSFQGRKAVWFSLDYEKVEELGVKGIGLVAESIKKVESRLPKVQIAPEDESILHTLPSANCTDYMVQNAHHLLNQPTTPESPTIAKGRRADSLRSPLLDTAPGNGHGTMREHIRQRHRTTLEKRFAKNHSSQAIEDLWEIMVIDRFGKEAYVPFSVPDKKNSKNHFIPWCEKAGVDLVKLLQWCVDNWQSLRDYRMAWAKLPKFPSFRSIYSLKDKFLEQFRLNGSGKHEAVKTRKEVYTDISQVPPDHPQFKQIKILIETKGRAEA